MLQDRIGPLLSAPGEERGCSAPIRQPELKQVPLPFMPPTFQVNIHWHRAGHDDRGNRWLRELVFSKIHILLWQPTLVPVNRSDVAEA